jgi:DNA-binding MarR family transcriptional regulator
MDFFDALVRYETSLWNHIEHRLAVSGAVTLSTFESLRVIARHEGSARVAELQDGLLITVGAASKLADRLERDDLAVRRAHPDDRRSSVIALTTLGARRHAEALTIVEETLAEHLSGVDTGAAVALFEVLAARLGSEVGR